jgi:hypothetical protein
MRWFWLFMMILSCVSETNAQSHGYSIDGKREIARIPFEVYNQLIVLKLRINGSKPLNFILDSGSKNTIIIEPSLVDSLNLIKDGKIGFLGAGNNDTVHADIVRNVSIESYRLKGKFQSILVLEKNDLHLKDILGIEIHGILGVDIFNRYVVGINYQKKTLTLKNPDTFTAPKDYTPIPLEVYNNKAYFKSEISSATGEKKPSKLMIDCGASLALMFNNISEKSGDFSFFSQYVVADIGVGLSGNIPGKVGRLNECDFGGFTFKNIPTSVVDLGLNDEFLLNERDGLIGSNILSRFNIWYDFHHGFMYLSPNNRYSEAFQYDRCGVTWDPAKITKGVMILKQVINGSPAAKAGLLPGDLILSINGKRIAFFDNPALNNLFRDPKIDAITFEILRDFKKLEVECIPEIYY